MRLWRPTVLINAALALLAVAELCPLYALQRARLARLRAEVALPEATTRLRDVQHLLCTLVETLDLHRVRYADDLDRA